MKFVSPLIKFLPIDGYKPSVWQIYFSKQQKDTGGEQTYITN